jgi:hypothetical protein
MHAIASILAGGLILLWPALHNGWPLVFTDTGAFLFAALERHPQWDKPIAYSLFLHALSWRVTYWGAAFAQGLIVAHLAWLALRTLAAASPARHLAVVVGLAALTSAPWFASQLMPDVLAATTALCVLLLGVVPERLARAERAWLALLAVLGAASHLSHLAVFLGLLLCLPVVRKLCGLRAWPGQGAAPLALAMLATFALLVGSNALMWGKPVVSPYGSVFPLARQLANGPAVDFLRTHCPGYLLCGDTENFSTDSDVILWGRFSPLWAHGDETVMAPEASRILAGTLRAYPAQVAANALRDSAIQAFKLRLGDSLTNAWLDVNVAPNLDRHLPHAAAAFRASRQMTERLGVVAWLNPVLLATLPASLLALPWLLRRARNPRLNAAALLVLLALAGNAVITGAMSKPHHRYQARIAWLLPLLAGVALAAPRRAPDKPHNGGAPHALERP